MSTVDLGLLESFEISPFQLRCRRCDWKYPIDVAQLDAVVTFAVTHHYFDCPSR